MKFIDEYRNPDLAKRVVEAIHRDTKGKWSLMEVCGGQTHTIVKYGIDELIPDSITLIHGPGCPVCVTPVEQIDKGIEIAAKPNVIFCTFGDMMRVPGSQTDLRATKASGGDVRIVYSPLDALRLAKENPDKEVVFFAVGFETTAPANAMTVAQAKREGIENFSLLVSQVMVPPAMEAVLSSPANRVNGFLAAGHVCTVMGMDEYFPISKKYRVPIVVTGFEPMDILQGIHMCVKQLESNQFDVENQYSRSVSGKGNLPAREMIQKIFKIIPRKWRGIGDIPQSGLGLSESYQAFDAENRFGVADKHVEENTECISGLVLQGEKKPHECRLFGNKCTPDTPIGATMVSGEGACAAYYHYRGLKH